MGRLRSLVEGLRLRDEGLGFMGGLRVSDRAYSIGLGAWVHG